MHQLSLPAILLASLTAFPSATSHPFSPAIPTGSDLTHGYWDVFYARGNAASGYRWVNLSANYTGPAGIQTTVTCKELYDPNTQETTSGCDDASFSYVVEEGWPESWITLKQTLPSGLANVTGKSLIEIECGKGAAGRACEGLVGVEASIEGPGGRGY